MPQLTRLSKSATAREKTLLVPDKGVDGLSAGVIIHRTLMLLGLPQSLIDVHLLQKDSNLYQEEERSAMKKKEPKYIIVLDQGSRPGPPITNSSSTKTLIIDHHLGDGFPEKAIVGANTRSIRLSLANLISGGLRSRFSSGSNLVLAGV